MGCGPAPLDRQGHDCPTDEEDPSSIERVITQLEKAGHLKRVERYYGRKHQTANAFDLSGLAKKLLQFEPEFRKAKEQNRLRKKKVEAA